MSPDDQPARPSGPQHSHRQTLYIVIGIVAAVLFAVVLPLTLTGCEMLFGWQADCLIDGVFRPSVAVLDLGGQIFLRLLKMIVVPLVIASVMTGILGMGDVRKLGRPGLRTVIFYLATTILAVILGIILVNVIRPGTGLDKKTVEELAKRVLAVAAVARVGVAVVDEAAVVTHLGHHTDEPAVPLAPVGVVDAGAVAVQRGIVVG